MSVASLLTQLCDIERWTPRTPSVTDYTLDPVAGESNFTAVATDVKCAIQEKGATKKSSVGGRSITFDAVGYFATGLDLRPDSADAAHDDRVRVTGGGLYYVRGVTDQTGRGAMLTVYLERADNT